ncbi:MAG: ATP-binding cassette domain-containing protein [Clostridiales bacterium]|nr:ATP-binding cassette domain-containing protein [Clostridiales bacterium]
MAHFEIKNLSFAYPGKEDKVLKKINLEINKGEYITMCGKSGSGKTTLLRQLKTTLAPCGDLDGEIFFEGIDLKDVDLRTQSSKIGYVMQNPDNQIVTDKVWHELAFGLESLGTDQQTMRIRVAEMASYFGIQTWFHKNVAELSGGQKQLLNLASIMAMQPSVLILDEPTSQLDPIAAADFLNTVKKINSELGTTVIITEHRLEEVFPACDRVVIMDEGQIVAVDTPRNIGSKMVEEGSDNFEMLPSPMKIYYGVESDLKCPLTVREGRNWLSEVFLNNEPKHSDAELKMPECEIGEDILEVKEAWFRYEKDLPDVLKGVSFKVKKGELFSIVGGNGTGKSTTLKAICNICKSYRGKVLVKGKDVNKFKNNELFHGCLAMLPQDPQSLFVKKTVEEDLWEMLDGVKLSNEEKEKLINEKIADCEIESLIKSHPYDLSGGEQQRVALAKVLLCQPKILLLDEPTKGIDSFFKINLAKIFDKLKAKGVTIIMVTHDIEFCAKYADRVAMFFDGSIVSCNYPQKFFSMNSFYTTSANRMSRHMFNGAVTNDDVIEMCQKNI